jgi:hypothetical protein
LGLSAVTAAQSDALFRSFEKFDFSGGAAAAKALEEALKGTGVSLLELDAIARRNGIQLLDAKGRVVEGALDQLEKAIKQNIDTITHFGNTLSEQDARLRARDALGLGPNAGLPADVQALARTRDLELSGLDLDAALEAKIAGLDLNTAEGRQAFLEFNRMLFQMADNGQLTADQLGKFESVDELLGPITDAATGITALGESALDAANELSIVPRGFRSAALAFEAQIPGLTGEIPGTRRIDQPLVNVKDLLPKGLEIGDANTLLDRMIPEPITAAQLLDRLIEFGAIPATTALPALPGDGAALPQIAASLTSSGNVLAQIAASLSMVRPAPEFEASQRETTAVLSRLAELLA